MTASLKALHTHFQPPTKGPSLCVTSLLTSLTDTFNYNWGSLTLTAFRRVRVKTHIQRGGAARSGQQLVIQFVETNRPLCFQELNHKLLYVCFYSKTGIRSVLLYYLTLVRGGGAYFDWMAFWGSNPGWRSEGRKDATLDRHIGNAAMTEEECGPCPVFCVLPRHSPYNWGKITEKPQSG